ncbi:protein of unknown function [Pseudodesulfovibrio piezophilus C1TLV30]|uniref:Uncharacterized protein n=1 Tax=Pseudodesulfovibrio piezophilus (strain DSM 21447 / JCM 15486 / C1TLV30) TaxID=1322246 RepID=M1WSI7_PSEP2|nr:protein of unknown function [Pseudodesulfovibrio piezophilus C1TLV30]
MTFLSRPPAGCVCKAFYGNTFKVLYKIIANTDVFPQAICAFSDLKLNDSLFRIQTMH